MSREIKFRAWIPSIKKMGEPFYLHDTITRYVPDENKYDVFPNESIFLQFTGLYDKHGKEIYEGDVLKSDTWANPRALNPYNVVIWKECGWKAAGYNGQIPVTPDLTVRRDFEVIGNIYDNPELITP